MGLLKPTLCPFLCFQVIEEGLIGVDRRVVASYGEQGPLVQLDDAVEPNGLRKVLDQALAMKKTIGLNARTTNENGKFFILSIKYTLFPWTPQ